MKRSNIRRGRDKHRDIPSETLKERLSLSASPPSIFHSARLSRRREVEASMSVKLVNTTILRSF